ncbi:hypothetical protein DPX16_0154 [Anabarilius grahami]|uniref:Uncharacterized protein n=1 Tax=Anabarilius grahami TaxID=495550 RepID=A0A3N0Z9D0_ANAGA|nr:hypothetical protein DPX16_0154 [Anabarilius grahami]
MENKPVRSRQLPTGKLEQSKGEPRYGRNERHHEGERAVMERAALISGLVPTNPFLPLLLNEYDQECSLKTRQKSPAPYFSMSRAFGEHICIASTQIAGGHDPACVLSVDTELEVSGDKNIQSGERIADGNAAASHRWLLESPAKEPIPTCCSFSNFPAQSVTFMPERGSNKNRSSLKLGHYDSHSSYEVFRKKFELVAEANGWDETEKVGQLAGALDGDAQQVLLDVQGSQMYSVHALHQALSRRFGDITPPMALRQQFQERTCRPATLSPSQLPDIQRKREGYAGSGRLRTGIDPRSVTAASTNSSAI